MTTKPYYVFTIEGHAYLVKLMTNRVFELSWEEYRAFLLYTQTNEIDPALLEKYGLNGADVDWEAGRRKRWETIFAQRHVHCIELMMAQECNMRCDYCYGEQNFGGSGLMDVSTAKLAVDRFLEAAPDRCRSMDGGLVISFFGGEPLLNFPAIQETVSYVWNERKRRDVTFSVTTNLSLLTDEMLAFLNQYPIGLLISFDGRMQRKYRRLASGKDSYDLVAANIQKALAVKPDSIGRATLYGEGNETDMTADLRAAGFTRGYITAASGSLMSGKKLKNKDDAYREMLETYPKLTRSYLKAIRERDEEAYRRITFDSAFMEAVGRGWNPSPNMISCGCGRTMYAIDVKGDVYPCHRFVGVSEWKLGNIREPFSALSTKGFSEHVTFLKPECASCFLRFTCGGSCLHENYCDVSAPNEEPSLHLPFESFCAYRRLTAELAIHMEHSLDEGDKAWLRTINRDQRGEETNP